MAPLILRFIASAMPLPASAVRCWYAQQFAGVGVEEHERVLFDPDGDVLAARISAASTMGPARLTVRLG
ncbi:hypothetical protein [Microbispora bryophytorum]|uniref:hypothetical protein n=1 Tax=Microbispora bryophytorum TaxID=1460882 RepID=UPI00115727BB|nr:hypothetical protein [Microbispora bryophytorum]MBD3138133.1 hypothetical protein [Microbispora bryophytorum]TQS03900.1 hypothetical protein FLX07_22050 [Microbispora bryophytorum]